MYGESLSSQRDVRSWSCTVILAPEERTVGDAYRTASRTLTDALTRRSADPPGGALPGSGYPATTIV